MKLICEQKELLKGLVIASKAISVNNTLPILNNILLKAEGQKLYFSATNLEIAVEYNINADIKNEGSITIPSKIITNYVNFLKDEKIELSSKDSNILIKSTNSNTEINGLPAIEYPSIPKTEITSQFKIKSNDLKDAIKKVVFASSISSTRPVLSGVYLNIKGNNFKLVATDSYRLSEKKIILEEKIEQEIKSIIPAKTIHELMRLIELEEKIEEVEVINSSNQILFKIGNIFLTSRLIEGIYPDYEQIIPKEIKTTLELESDDFILTLKRINLFAKENNNNITLEVNSQGELQINTSQTQIGSEKSIIQTKINGIENKIALNSQYLLDILNNLNTKEIILKMNEKINPIIIHPKDVSDFTHIIMPLKL